MHLFFTLLNAHSEVSLDQIFSITMKRPVSEFVPKTSPTFDEVSVLPRPHVKFYDGYRFFNKSFSECRASIRYNEMSTLQFDA